MKVIQEKNLKGMICPYIILEVLKEISLLKSSQCIKFHVDDRMAPAEIEEEIGNDDSYKIEIVEKFDTWEIVICSL
ncbi:MAG: sulfurtransferase TusA family protein [Candidatus Zixiibacteriota bacterium]